MSITTDLQAMIAAEEQQRRVISARSALQQWMWATAEVVAKVQALVDEGALNTIPTSVKNALNKAWTVTKTANNSMKADADIQEVLKQ